MKPGVLVSPVEYAGGKRSLQAYIAVCPQTHCDPSSFSCVYLMCSVLTSEVWRNGCGVPAILPLMLAEQELV